MRTGRYITRRHGCGTGSTRAATAGVTLTELLVVLVLMGMMAAIAIPTFTRGGFFSRNETQYAASELYKLMNACRVYAATYRVNTGLACGAGLKIDSSSGSAIETIQSVAMIYQMPKGVAERCTFGDGVPIPENPKSPYYSTYMEKHAYIFVAGEHERGSFRKLPGGAAILADRFFTAQGGSTFLPRTCLVPVRIYRVEARGDATFQADLITPLCVPDADSVLANLPADLQYLTALPSGSRCLGYYEKPIDYTSLSAPNRDIGKDFCFPAFVFTSSGRVETIGSSPAERFEIVVAYAPDEEPKERFVDPDAPIPNTDDLLDTYRGEKIELFRGTGRASIVPDED